MRKPWIGSDFAFKKIAVYKVIHLPGNCNKLRLYNCERTIIKIALYIFNIVNNKYRYRHLFKDCYAEIAQLRTTSAAATS
ncbi:MAG: hypothetical protein BGO48_02495 [Mucilaginibacter sp. 44-25]|nr:MAG: hypothetical protein BGO48_02495 [Mucilaginibacter sp. 44-25]